MTDPMANPLHACDVADRVEQLTEADLDCDGTAACPPVASEWSPRTAGRSVQRPDDTEHQEAAPEKLLAYAVSSLDEPVSVADIDEAFGITADHLFTTVLEHLEGHPHVTLNDETVTQVKDRAQKYLWVHRC
ncbi:hypothetical protein [Williamsia herbipolensis]|uniref:hypothetical protein n=1 Tax=Williamsia herbipolensis TaxID=1603258 RepID=UPI000B045D19|nr:hypothetical protein [Williamsia herbipolensis]